MSPRRPWTVIVFTLIVGAGISPGCGDDPPGAPSSYTPVFEPLALTRVAPDSGPTESAVPVTLIGTGFKNHARVTIDGAPVEAVVTGSTRILTTAPPHAAGPVEIAVTNPDGQRVALASGYRYVLVTVTAVTPAAGLSGDGVAIIGTGLVPGARVTFGGIPGIVTFSGFAGINAVLPPHSAGPVDVVVTNPGGQSGTLEGGFRYQTVSVTAGASTVAAGGQLPVTWEAPPGRGRFDWIGVIRAGAAAGNCDHDWWHYVDGAPSGTISAFAPLQPGQYEFRYFVSDSCTDAGRSNPFTVTAAGSTAAFRSTPMSRGRGR